MIHISRGEVMTFSETFTDANDNVATVTTATVTIVFPTSSPPGNILAHDPGQLKGKTVIPMSVESDGVTWSTTWDTSESDPGAVYWNIRTTGATPISSDGVFVLDGNLANIEA